MPALVRLAELLGVPVAQSGKRAYHCFPMTHPLFQGFADLSKADLVLALDIDIPWLPGPNGPPDDAYAAIVDVEPSKRRIPTMEFTADLRLTADALLTIEALEAEIRSRITPEDRQRFASRAARWAAISAERRQKLIEAAQAASTKTPIDGKWLSYQIGKALDDDCVVFDDTIVLNQVHDYLQCDRPGSYFNNPASSGGWAPGAAFGAKLAAPDRDVVAITGDGFYMFASADPLAVVVAAVQRAVPDDRLPEPQLFDRHDPRRAQLSGRLFGQGRLPRRLLRSADRLRQGGRGGRRLWRERHRPGARSPRRSSAASPASATARSAVISVWLARYLQED